MGFIIEIDDPTLALELKGRGVEVSNGREEYLNLTDDQVSKLLKALMEAEFKHDGGINFYGLREKLQDLAHALKNEEWKKAQTLMETIAVDYRIEDPV